MKTKLYPMTAALAATALIALSFYTIQAQDGKGRKGGACRADVERLCGDIEKGEGRIRKCMKEKKDQLSAECRAKMEQRMEARKKLREACKEDHKKHCKGKRGKERRQCMLENKSQFSAGCQAAMSEMEAKWEKRKNRKGRK